MPKRSIEKLFQFIFAILLVLMAVSPANADDLKSFSGEVADSSCALNVHSLTRSHREMLKSKSMGTDGASCSRYCVTHLSADYVLVSKKDVYRLDQQEQAEKLAGRRVRINGTLDPKTNTIHVSAWQPQGGAAK